MLAVFSVLRSELGDGLVNGIPFKVWSRSVKRGTVLWTARMPTVMPVDGNALSSEHLDTPHEENRVATRII